MDAGNPVLDFEAPKDPGAHRQGNAHVTDNEILGKCHKTLSDLHLASNNSSSFMPDDI